MDSSRRIHQHGLVIEQDIAVVGHTARNWEKVFKSAQAAVAAANINEIFLDLLVLCIARHLRVFYLVRIIP